MLTGRKLTARIFFFASIVVVGVAMSIAAIAFFSSSYQTCVANEHDQNTYEKEQGAFTNIGIMVRCEVGPVDRHAGTLSAIGTFIIAFFTLTLWVTSGNQARELKRSVNVSFETAQADLRAYVDIEDIYFLYRGENNRYDGELRDFTSIQRLRVTNYGRTPATDLSIWINNTCPPVPPENFIIPYPGKPTFTPHYLGPTRRFGTRLEHMPDGFIRFTHKDHFFTYGRIQYRDIYRRWWVEWFVYEHIPPRTFRPYGNYNHEQEAGKGDTPNV